VISGDERFFTITKRLGVALYGCSGDGGPLGAAERADYLAALGTVRDRFGELLRPGDAVLLHDHQTAGLVRLLGDEVSVYWRCHVGVDEPTEASERAWDFTAPMVAAARGLIFSVGWHVPTRLRDARASVLPPFISPFAPKNCDLDEASVGAALAHCGLRDGAGAQGQAELATPAGPIRLRHPAVVRSDAPPRRGEPLSLQVSRWDRLKDMDGVLTSFTSFVDHGYLALVGPDPTAIPDDIEQGVWYDKCLSAWQSLPAERRRRVALVCLPMADLDENAVLVNALQRAADVVLQKSLAEGFGLTVAEAMWKSRVIVASAVGGIRAQIDHRHNGLLVQDPADLKGFGSLMTQALKGGVTSREMGARAHERVLRDFLPDRDVVATARLLSKDIQKWR
jgi:trehalose synthase